MTTQPPQTNTAPAALRDIYAAKSFVLSYELFPPKTAKGRQALRKHVTKLLEFEPDFITCTYGAGGANRAKTLDTLALVQDITAVPVASHLTCVGATKADLRAYLQRAHDQGIKNIVAIRGDAPKDDDAFKPVQGGLAYGNELVDLIHTEFPQFGIAVGGYPETHPEALTPDADLTNLKRKVDAGADVVITQMFYRNDGFYRWRDRCAAAGISVPIVPGVLPVTNFAQIQRIAGLCGADLPEELCQRLGRCGEDFDAQLEIGVAWATEQMADLVEQGIPGVHLYVLNQSRAATELLHAVNLPGTE